MYEDLLATEQDTYLHLDVAFKKTVATYQTPKDIKSRTSMGSEGMDTQGRGPRKRISVLGEIGDLCDSALDYIWDEETA